MKAIMKAKVSRIVGGGLVYVELPKNYEQLVPSKLLPGLSQELRSSRFRTFTPEKILDRRGQKLSAVVKVGSEVEVDLGDDLLIDAVRIR